MTYLTERGLSAPTEAQILATLRANYEVIIGQSVDWDSDTFEGAFSLAVARALSANADSLQSIWDGLSLNTASGTSLEYLGAYINVFREPPVASSVELALTGTGGTLINDGAIVEDPDGNRWELQESIFLPDTGVFRAQENGPIEAAAGTTWEIITPVNGWTGATNASAAAIGRNTESDLSLRRRIRTELSGGRPSSFRGIESAIRALPFIQTSLVVHNPRSDPNTVRGLSLPANSFQVIVFPNTITSDEETQLFEAILEVAPIGIESVGDEELLIEEWPVRFSYASEVLVNVDIDAVGVAGASTSEVEANIEAQLESFFANLQVGQSVTLLAVLGTLSLVQGLESVTSLELNASAANLSIAADEYARLGTVTVNI